MLRAVLAPYVDAAPDTLAFVREDHGRPFLDRPGAPDFNLSDTVGGTLVAVCGAGRVGVDVELIDREFPALRLARRYYTQLEADALAALDEPAARRQYLRWWTAKEAACKATGTGLSGWLAQWRFAGDSDDAHPRLCAWPEHAGECSRWQFARCVPAPGFSAALAWWDAPVGAAGRVRAFAQSGAIPGVGAT